ncbi:hypothetical protein Tco_0856427 [Tanacetum coccineum]|uniref:Uncharacterized protein n=1 Tax=Tanacetum coccineum TaxID=301880 RepID=A0ABQ5B3R8_9ASTR
MILLVPSTSNSSKNKGRFECEGATMSVILVLKLVPAGLVDISALPKRFCNLTEYPIAKMLWDALVVTYSSGRDKLQTFNLHVKANDIKQNSSSLEDF